MKYSSILAISVLLLCGTVAHAAGNLSAEEILKVTDRSRGGGMAGIQWELKIIAMDPDTGENIRKLLVRASGDNSVAETIFPARAAGGRLLQLGRNMWYGRPDLQKPVSISSRQKLIGPAANGDIASTNYVKDYDAKIIRMDSFEGEPVYVLELKGKSHFVTYDKIIYWVSEGRVLPVKAEFMTVSGKIFKTAVFETKNTISVDGKKVPFVSRMTIRDNYNNDRISILEYSSVKVGPFPTGMFSVSRLMR